MWAALGMGFDFAGACASRKITPNPDDVNGLKSVAKVAASYRLPKPELLMDESCEPQKAHSRRRNNELNVQRPSGLFMHGVADEEASSFRLWAGAEQLIERFSASPGPVSCHARVCELFYQLKGGTVDYERVRKAVL